MNTGEVYIEVITGLRFEVIHDCATHGMPGWMKFRCLDDGELYLFFGHPSAFERHFRPERPGGDDVMALAEAFGVAAETARPPGAQPAVEFTAGPTSYGPVWSDANLAKVFGLDQPGGAR